MTIDHNQSRQRFDRVDAEWAMEQGWATAPVLAAILEQVGGSVVLDPEAIERHLAAGTAPRFLIEDSPHRRLSVRLPTPTEPAGLPPRYDPCPTCGRAVTRIAESAAQPCGHRVNVALHSDDFGPYRYELTPIPDDHGSTRRRHLPW